MESQKNFGQKRNKTMKTITFEIHEKIHEDIVKLLQEEFHGTTLNQFIIDTILDTLDVWKDKEQI